MKCRSCSLKTFKTIDTRSHPNDLILKRNRNLWEHYDRLRFKHGSGKENRRMEQVLNLSGLKAGVLPVDRVRLLH